MSRVYYKGIQLETIRSFCRLARLGNYAEVADELGLSVPTISRQVKALERECGVVLLDRHGRGVRLTDAGKEALRLFEPHVTGIETAQKRLSEQLASQPKRLTVAAPAMLLSDYLAEPLARVIAEDQQVLLSLVNEPSDVSITAVLNGQADVGVVTRLAEETADPLLHFEDLFQLPWHVGMEKSHALAERKKLHLEDLVKWPWVLPAAETQPRRRIDAVLRREKLIDCVRVVMESRTFALTETYVKQGFGLTFYYGRDMNHPPTGIKLLTAEQWFGSVTVSLVTRLESELTPQAVNFLEIMREFSKEPVRQNARGIEKTP